VNGAYCCIERDGFCCFMTDGAVVDRWRALCYSVYNSRTYGRSRH
jgi:hypothetical protein